MAKVSPAILLIGLISACSEDGVGRTNSAAIGGAGTTAVTTCLDDVDCPGATVCHRAQCVVADCVETSDCSVGLICENRRCSPRPDGGCTREEDCPLHLTCRLVAGEPGRCVSVSCVQDLDCRGRDARCDRGSQTCEPDQRPRCVTDRDCPWESTTRCNRILRRCEMKEEEGACAGDFWCDRGQRCDRQTRNCVAVEHCSNDLECVLGQRCESLRCRDHQLGDPCVHDGECPDDALCREARCVVP